MKNFSIYLIKATQPLHLNMGPKVAQGAQIDVEFTGAMALAHRVAQV